MWRLSRLGDAAGKLLLVVLVAVAAGVWLDVRDVQSRIAEQGVALSQVLGKVARMTTFTTSWTDTSGQNQSVTTTCRENEEPSDCVVRHEAAVAALKKIHPPR